MSLGINPASAGAIAPAAASSTDAAEKAPGGLSTTAKVVLGAGLGLGATLGGIVGFRAAAGGGSAVAKAAIGAGVGLAVGGGLAGLAALGGATHSDDHYYYDPYPYYPEPYYPEPYYPDPYYPDPYYPDPYYPDPYPGGGYGGTGPGDEY